MFFNAFLDSTVTHCAVDYRSFQLNARLNQNRTQYRVDYDNIQIYTVHTTTGLHPVMSGIGSWLTILRKTNANSDISETRTGNSPGEYFQVIRKVLLNTSVSPVDVELNVLVWTSELVTAYDLAGLALRSTVSLRGAQIWHLDLPKVDIFWSGSLKLGGCPLGTLHVR